MNLLVWVMMGIAIWHFAIFVPDHFWGGIVGAFGFAVVGSVVVGLALAGGEIDDASLVTAFQAIPGTILALGLSYYIGKRREDPSLTHLR
jgi:ABC-type dipeptide/oligopeptide/nickel transport system permease subunit